jgi:hypothetical protein
MSILHNVIVYVGLKIATSKTKNHELIWFRKLLGKNTYQNSGVCSVTKAKYKHEVLFISSVHDLDAFFFLTLALVTLTQLSTSGKGTARWHSTALRVRREYLNLE